MTHSRNAVSEFAGAKINLSLRVTGRRADGYHLLESLVVHSRDVGDALCGGEVPEHAESSSLSIEGPFGVGLAADQTNLVLRAAAALCADRRASMVLEKHLPVASGIGGGSSDAAAALRLLNRLWGLGRSEEALREIGHTLGADVPMCVCPQSAFVTGIGEEISPVSMPPLDLVLANAGTSVSTPAVFARLDGQFSPSLRPPARFKSPLEVAEFARTAGNSLFSPACSLAPTIAQTRNALEGLDGCLFAAMSGSGATCYGLFETSQAAQKAAALLSAAQPRWWVRHAST